MQSRQHRFRRIIMENQEQHITIIAEDGSEQLCEIIFTFDSDETGYSYVIYSPIGNDEDDDVMYAARYIANENGEEGELCQIETDEEWSMVEEVVGTFMAEDEE